MRSLFCREHGSGLLTSLLVSAKICIKEASDGRIGDQAISTLDETMTLILETHVLYGNIPRTQRRYDLLGLSDGNTRIVGTMHDEEGRDNAIHVANGRDLLQECTVVFQAAILGFTQFAPPGAGIFEEGHEIGDTYDIHGYRPEVRIGCDGREHHKSAIAATHDRYLLRISNATLAQPEYGLLQVCH